MDSSSDPSVVYLIRHGEKLGDANNDKDGSPDLSVRGSARAAALPSLFLPGPRITADAPTAPRCALDANGGSFTGMFHEVPQQAVARRVSEPRRSSTPPAPDRTSSRRLAVTLQPAIARWKPSPLSPPCST